MTERVIALDPGGTTGWAEWSSTPYHGGVGIWEHYTCGQIGEPGLDYHLELDEFLGSRRTENFIVIDETFEFRQGDNDREGIDLISREYIGVAKRWCQENGVRHVKQSPGEAKGFIPDKPKNGLAANEKLKVLGLWVPGKRHAMDAMRHLLYYQVNRQHKYGIIKPWQQLT